MLKKTITYLDYNDQKRTDDFYFNLEGFFAKGDFYNIAFLYCDRRFCHLAVDGDLALLASLAGYCAAFYNS